MQFRKIKMINVPTMLKNHDRKNPKCFIFRVWQDSSPGIFSAVFSAITLNFKAKFYPYFKVTRMPIRLSCAYRMLKYLSKISRQNSKRC